MSFTVEKEWNHEGNTCVVIMTAMGHRCGYVGIDKTHPLFALDYTDEVPSNLLQFFEKVKEGPVGKRGIIDMVCCDPEHPTIGILFDVHGGITYSGGNDYPIKGDLWWFGYDCAHCDDGPLGGGPVRSLDYCIAECESLSRQLNEVKEICK